MDDQSLAGLFELLRIPSVSTAPEHAPDVLRAADWVAGFLERCGATVARRGKDGGYLVDACLAPSARGEAPTVLCYGHFDVQPPGPLELWESPPFAPEVRDGWLYARGVADDKGQLWMLLQAAERHARAGTLPVRLRFLLDGEEEVGGMTVPELVAAEASAPEVCVIFDTAMLGPGRPVFNLATRGTAYFRLRLRTGERDLHSGVFGGAALNAAHALIETLAAVLPRQGRLLEALQVGTQPPSAGETTAWSELEPGRSVLAGQGARPVDAAAAAAADDFYRRTWAGIALDVHGLAVGDAEVMKTIVPCAATATLSLRLAPGQSLDQIVPELERLLHAAKPEGADLDVELLAACDPGWIDPDAPALQIAAEAFRRVLGVRPAFVRSGGSIPIVAALTARGVPAIVTGFDLPDGRIHAANERLRLDHLDLGVAAAHELFAAFGSLDKDAASG